MTSTNVSSMRVGGAVKAAGNENCMGLDRRFDLKMGDMGNPCEVAKGAAVGHWGQMVISFSFLHSFKTFYCNASQFMNCISIKWTENRLLGNCFLSMCFHETYLVRFSTLNRPICVLLATFQCYQCSGPKGNQKYSHKEEAKLAWHLLSWIYAYSMCCWQIFSLLPREESTVVFSLKIFICVSSVVCLTKMQNGRHYPHKNST